MKRLTLIATQNADGTISIETNVDGFDGNEIVGILETKKYDIIDQMCGKTKFTRVRTYPDGSVVTTTTNQMCKYHNPKMDELLSYYKRLYKLPGCGAGGCLHILLDDDNYDDDSLKFCRDYCAEHAEGEERELANKILDMYEAMSLTERTVFDWYLNGNDLKCPDPTKCETCDLCEIPDYMEE